jgi:hypothetical protein
MCEEGDDKEALKILGGNNARMSAMTPPIDVASMLLIKS